MVFEIRVTGLKEVQKLVSSLPPSVRKEVGQKGIFKLAQNLQSRIRRRYTLVGYGLSGSTGKGFKSIIAKSTSEGATVKVGLNAPWVVMMEEGVRDHWVSPYTIRQHLRSPGSTVGKRAPRGQYGGPPIWWRWKGPFVEPAMMAFRPEIPRLLTKYVKQAIKNAGGKNV